MHGDDVEGGDGLVSPPDRRAVAAWVAWLGALANDAEAALAAALTYESLDDASRDVWLDALEQDAESVAAPRIAIYAPLLSVERDPTRLARIHRAVGPEPEQAVTRPEARALRGVAEDGTRVVSLVLPLYLSFVQVVSCRYHPAEGFLWARHEPIVRDQDAPRAGRGVDGVELERTPMKPVVEELAHAVLAQKRRGQPAPEALRMIIDLFTPQLDE